MGKLILMSVVVATAMIAALAARDRSPRRGLIRGIWALLLFNAVYAFLVAWVYPRLDE